MKTFLKYSGVCAAVFAIVAFIMLLACNAITYESLLGTTNVGGTIVLFGGKIGALTYKLAPLALIAFILIIVALVIIIAGIVLPLAKVTALDKFSGILNLIAVAALIVAGIFVFISANNFASVNEISSGNLTPGYVFTGIFAIVAGVLAVLPAVANLISKK